MNLRYSCSNLNDLPLFASASEREARHRRPFPWYIRAIAKRTGVTPQHAATICPLAGIGPEQCR